MLIDTFKRGSLLAVIDCEDALYAGTIGRNRYVAEPSSSELLRTLDFTVSNQNSHLVQYEHHGTTQVL